MGFHFFHLFEVMFAKTKEGKENITSIFKNHKATKKEPNLFS